MRIGIDLGGTKISGVVLDADGGECARRRVATPQGDYAGTVAAVASVVRLLEGDVGYGGLPVGIGTPGSIAPGSGLLRNANSICLNGQPLQRDLEAALGRPVRMANDADCLAMSEAHSGAGQGQRLVFAAILGTGVGGGLAFDGRVWTGRNGVAGEWGHTAQPWLTQADGEARSCWCGLSNCIETWLSGPGLTLTHRRASGVERTAATIADSAAGGDAAAQDSLNSYCSQLARALAGVINILDPDVIVLGGGVSQIRTLYETVPRLWSRWIFADTVTTELHPAQHGDDSGVRGAAWLPDNG